MSLPDDEEIKQYLRVTTDVEDQLISSINASAKALVATGLKVPLETTQRTFYGRRPRLGRRGERDTRLVIPVIPCAATATVVNIDGTTVGSATYAIDSRTGWVDAVRYSYFTLPPYDITVDVGWPLHAEYDDVIEPLLRQAIIDFASDLYRRRNPAAVYEQSGGQVSITYTEQELADRTRLYLSALQGYAAPSYA